MNPSVEQHRPPPHPHRPSFSCDLHPSEKFNGFCPSCLCDRLTTLHPSSSAATSSLFRRTKSFSASNHNNRTAFVPHRRSCDVRATLPTQAASVPLNSDRNVGSQIGDFGGEIRVVVPIEAPIEIADFGGKIRARDPIEVGGTRALNHNVGHEIGDFGGNIRISVPIREGGARALNHNVGDEIKDFGKPIRVSVPIEAGGTQDLAHNVGDKSRDFGKKFGVSVPTENPVGSIEEKSRVRVPIEVGRAQTLAHKLGDEIKDFGKQGRVRVSIEAGRGRALGCNVDDKIKVFEEQISPIEVQSRVWVPIEAGGAQNLAHNVGSEIRPFDEKTRIMVPNQSARAQAINHNVGDEIMVLEERIAPIEEQAGRAQNLADEIRVFEEKIEEETKRMRDHIDLDFQSKKKKPSVGFWSAASVFSKKWNKWMKKQKAKKQGSGMEKTVLPLDRHRETQSEVGDYGLGRRSCDTDPRFSIDIGRLSIDGPHPSFDPPRASWDEHMTRRSNFNFSDHRFPTIETIPGDTLQTHQYYLDTSSRRRRSFDRSGLKTSSSLVIGAEVDEMKLGSNAKVTPETFDFHKRKSNSNSLRVECSEIFELGIRDDGSVIGNVEEKGSKRSGRWGKKWSFWGLIYKRNKYNEDDRASPVKGNIRGDTSGDMYRRSSSVSLTSSYNMSGLSGSVRNKGAWENGRKKRDDLVLDRNQSVDNGLLRFYLTPPRSKSRVFGSRKSSGTDNSRSIPKSVYRY